MVKCIIFYPSDVEKCGRTMISGPEIQFNEFCEKHRDIKVIKIDTIIFGSSCRDRQIFLYYEDSSDDFKPSDEVMYTDETGLNFYGTICKTGHLTCTIKIGDETLETSYRNIRKIEEA